MPALEYSVVERFVKLFGAQLVPGDSLAGKLVSTGDEVLVKLDGGVVLSAAEYSAAEYETVLCHGCISLSALHGDAAVRFRQSYKVKSLAAQFINYGYLKNDPVKISLRDHREPRKRGHWCFGSDMVQQFGLGRDEPSGVVAHVIDGNHRCHAVAQVRGYSAPLPPVRTGGHLYYDRRVVGLNGMIPFILVKEDVDNAVAVGHTVNAAQSQHAKNRNTEVLDYLLGYMKPSMSNAAVGRHLMQLFQVSSQVTARTYATAFCTLAGFGEFGDRGGPSVLEALAELICACASGKGEAITWSEIREPPFRDAPPTVKALVLRQIARRLAAGERGDQGGSVRLFSTRQDFNDFVFGLHEECHRRGEVESVPSRVLAGTATRSGTVASSGSGAGSAPSNGGGAGSVAGGGGADGHGGGGSGDSRASQSEVGDVDSDGGYVIDVPSDVSDVEEVVAVPAVSAGVRAVGGKSVSSAGDDRVQKRSRTAERVTSNSGTAAAVVSARGSGSSGRKGAAAAEVSAASDIQSAGDEREQTSEEDDGSGAAGANEVARSGKGKRGGAEATPSRKRLVGSAIKSGKAKPAARVTQPVRSSKGRARRVVTSGDSESSCESLEEGDGAGSSGSGGSGGDVQEHIAALDKMGVAYLNLPWDEAMVTEQFKALAGKVGLVLTDPPYGILNVEHDMKLSHEEILAVLRAIATLLVPGGTAIIFLDPEGMVDWHIQLRNVTTLVVDQWLHVVYEQRFTKAKPHTKLVNYVQLALVLHKPQPGQRDSPCNSNYMSPPYRNGVTRDMDLPINANAILRYKRPGRSERCVGPNGVLRKEQKSVWFLKELIGRFTKPADIVLDFFGGTGSSLIAAASMDRLAYGCEKDAVCWRFALAHMRGRIGCAVQLGDDIPVAEDVASALVAKAKVPEDKATLEHAKAEARGRGLEIKDSAIANAALGVFATRAVGKGAVVLAYWGEVVVYTKVDVMRLPEEVHSDRLLDTRYRLPGAEPPGRYLYVVGSLGCAASYMNTHTNSEAGSPNVMFMEAAKGLKPQHDPLRLVKVVAIRDIPAGEELLVSYGTLFPLSDDEIEDDDSSSVGADGVAGGGGQDGDGAAGGDGGGGSVAVQQDGSDGSESGGSGEENSE